MNESLLSPEQHLRIQRALADLRAAFPGMRDNQIVELFVAETVQLPPYSTLRHALVTTVSSVMVGAATLCYGKHPETEELSIVLIRRSEIGADGQYNYGIIGGFTNPGFYALEKSGVTPYPDEQPRDGARRENREELVDGKGKPLLTLDPSRLVIIDEGIDERALGKGCLATHYSGYAVELTDREMNHILKHSRRMRENTAYWQAVKGHSGGEVVHVDILNLRDAANLKPEQFTHPHELHAIRILYELTQAPATNPRHSIMRRSLDEKLHL